MPVLMPHAAMPAGRARAALLHGLVVVSVAAAVATTLAGCGGGGGGGGSASGGTSAVGSSAPPASPVGLQIGNVVWPVDVWAGSSPSDGQVNLSVTGGEGKVTWSVDCGVGLSCHIDNGVLQLRSEAAGGIVRASVTLTATDSGGAKASTTHSVNAWPPSVSQYLQTLAGAGDRAGVHLVILSDGFTEKELVSYRLVVDAFLEKFFSRPEIAAHRGAWNVHRVDLPADPSSSAPLGSRVGATLGCSGVLRLLCVDAAQAQRIAAVFVPHYTQVLVVVNSPAYGGSGGVVTAITAAPEALPNAIHELGHSFAGLADEYVDVVSAVQNPFVEGAYPNVTAYTDAQHIPWRLWIEPGTPLPTLGSPTLPGDFVGLFEGGLFRDRGVYRPTFASFMNVGGDAPMGPVNGEAWARQLYAKGGAWADSSPDTTAALDRKAQPADGWLFKAKALMDRSVCETRWYVNGVERADQRGAGQLLLADPGALQVRVDLVDMTGRVRQDQGVVSTLHWSVQ